MNEIQSTQNYVQIAASFWQKAGGMKSWPCDLEQAVALNLPLDTVYLSKLTIQKIKYWFNERNIFYPFPQNNSELHGCLIAYRGNGLIFIDGSDAKENRLYTLAHEVDHFILEYLIPRLQACNLFGENIIEVLDGIRPPSIDERIDSILNAINIRPYIHLLEHQNITSSYQYQIWKAENRADQLSLELIAPYKLVFKDLKRAKKTASYQECFEAATNLLLTKYGLPISISKGYARNIARSITGGESVLSYLGLE